MKPPKAPRLTDRLWLAAHDSVNGKSWIGGWPLGVGLTTGLLAELVHSGFLELRQGELFRTTAGLPDDPALRPLLIKMEAEERNWLIPRPSARALAAAGARDDWDWPPPRAEGRDGPTPAPARQEDRHRMRSHELGTWMSYLAYEQRAEKQVIDRLSRSGLVRRVERRRLLGGTAVRYVPYDSVTAGTPASLVKTAVQRGRELSTTGLFLAGLFVATGLHHHALATLSPGERDLLAEQLGRGLDAMSRELLRAANAAVGDAAMR